MHAIQIVLITFAVFAMSRVLLRFKRGGMRAVDLFLWLVFWVGVSVVAFHPGTTDKLAIWLGVGRGVDTAMYIALLLIFYLLFRAFGKMEDLNRQITRVVRAMALREMEEDLKAERDPKRADTKQP